MADFLNLPVKLESPTLKNIVCAYFYGHRYLWSLAVELKWNLASNVAIIICPIALLVNIKIINCLDILLFGCLSVGAKTYLSCSFNKHALT